MTNYRDNYVCAGCSAIGVKLWRDYQTTADACELRCAECATKLEIARNKNSDQSPLDEDGVFTFRDGDQIGGLVPAVPKVHIEVDGVVYRGRRSVNMSGSRIWIDGQEVGVEVDNNVNPFAAALPLVEMDGVQKKPTDDGSTFWGYTSVSPEGVAWWHDLPTYLDPDADGTRERRCLENLLKRAELGQAFWPERLACERRDTVALARQLDVEPPAAPIATLARAGLGDGSLTALRLALLSTYRASDMLYQEWRTITAFKRDLQWKIDRLVYVFIQPHTLTIWGTVTKLLDNDMVLRYGAELPHAVMMGARLAVVPGGEAHLIGEVDSYQESALIMDDDRNGDALISRLTAAGVIAPSVIPNGMPGAIGAASER